MDPHLDEIVALLTEPSQTFNFSHFARTVGNLPTSLHAEATAILTSQLHDFVGQHSEETIVSIGKVSIGLGVIAASQLTAAQQMTVISTAFFPLLNQESNDPHAQRIVRIISDVLINVDKFLFHEARKQVREKIRELCELEILDLNLEILDYNHAQESLEEYENLSKIFTDDPDDTSRGKKPRVFVVCSAKGGVGKSTVSNAILQYLREDGSGREGASLLIDLDFYGPTAQFQNHVPVAAKALSPFSILDRPVGQEWCYPTLQDLHTFFSGSKKIDVDAQETKRTVENLVNRIVLQLGDRCDEFAVLLPDSPIFCADFFRHDLETNIRAMIRSLESVIDGSRSRGVSDVVIDLPPGLFGINGALLKWLSKTYRAVPVLVVSPRVADLSAAIYESSWMSSSGEFGWTNDMLVLVNMWAEDDLSLTGSEDDIPLTVLDNVADSLLKTVLETIGQDSLPRRASFLMLFVRRMWAYIHAVSIKSPTNRMRIHLLPYDDTIRRSSYLSAYEEGIDHDTPMLSIKDTWYKFFRKYLKTVLGSDKE